MTSPSVLDAARGWQGTAALVVTHDHRTLDVFDELHEMEDGRLGPVAQGPAAAGSASEAMGRDSAARAW